jgi:hypothetical protein
MATATAQFEALTDRAFEGAASNFVKQAIVLLACVRESLRCRLKAASRRGPSTHCETQNLHSAKIVNAHAKDILPLPWALPRRIWAGKRRRIVLATNGLDF